MKKLTKELKPKSVVELEKIIHGLHEELAKGKLESKVSQQKDTNVLKKKRKKLAAVLTIYTEKKELDKIKKPNN